MAKSEFKIRYAKNEDDENIIEVFTPYNKQFVSRIRNFGGSRWDDNKKCWILPENAISEIRKVMFDVYGESDISHGKYVNVRLQFLQNFVKNSYENIVFFAKIVATWYKFRKISRDVIYLSGDFYGSDDGKIVIEQGTEILLKNVPIVLAQHYQNFDSVKITIEDNDIDNYKINCKELLAEKDNLQQRINEINELLSKMTLCDFEKDIVN